MSAHADEPLRPLSPIRRTIRFYVGLFGMFCVGLTLLFAALEAVEFVKKVNDGEMKKSVEEYKEKIGQSVEKQSDALHNTRPRAMMNVYLDTLQQTDCNWLFRCHERTFGPDDYYWARGIRMGLKPDPIVQSGPVLIPTGRTFRGSPHALMEMAGAVWVAGMPAVLMFLACTVLWLALVLYTLGKAGDLKVPGFIPFSLITISPFGITLLVACVQWVAEAALRVLSPLLGPVMGRAVSGAAYVAAYSSALAVVVGLRHAWKSPHEWREAAEVMRGR